MITVPFRPYCIDGWQCAVVVTCDTRDQVRKWPCDAWHALEGARKRPKIYLKSQVKLQNSWKLAVTCREQVRRQLCDRWPSAESDLCLGPCDVWQCIVSWRYSKHFDWIITGIQVHTAMMMHQWQQNESRWVIFNIFCLSYLSKIWAHAPSYG